MESEDELTYDEIVELIVDAGDDGTHWAPYQDRKILMALRELQQRRIDERVANNLAAADGKLKAPNLHDLRRDICKSLTGWRDAGAPVAEVALSIDALIQYWSIYARD